MDDAIRFLVNQAELKGLSLVEYKEFVVEEDSDVKRRVLLVLEFGVGMGVKK